MSRANREKRKYWARLYDFTRHYFDIRFHRFDVIHYNFRAYRTLTTMCTLQVCCPPLTGRDPRMIAGARSKSRESHSLTGAHPRTCATRVYPGNRMRVGNNNYNTYYCHGPSYFTVSGRTRAYVADSRPRTTRECVWKFRFGPAGRSSLCRCSLLPEKSNNNNFI